MIDDAWRGQDLAPFLHRGPKDQTTRLVTTRDDHVVPPDVARLAVDAMTVGEAQEMLSRGMPAPIAAVLRPRLVALAGRLGEWPLLLGLANGVVRSRMALGASAADALAYAEGAIAQRGIGKAFRADDCESRRRTAWGTLEVGLEQLGADERARFAELAVFIEDAEIPTTAAIGLWRQTAALDPLDGENLLAGLAALPCCGSWISAAVCCVCTMSCVRCSARVRSRGALRNSTVSSSHISERRDHWA